MSLIVDRETRGHTHCSVGPFLTPVTDQTELQHFLALCLNGPFCSLLRRRSYSYWCEAVWFSLKSI